MPMIFNGGATGARADATEANALTIVDALCADLKIPRQKAVRNTATDSPKGLFGFVVCGVQVDVPGDDPEEVFKGRPFKSRRLYVDGSSWWYGHAVHILEGKLADLAAG